MPFHLLFPLPVTLFLNMHTFPHISLRFILKCLISKTFSDYRASLVAQLVKNPRAIQETLVRFLGWAPGVGSGKWLQYSCLENSMDRGAQQATVHGVSRVGHDLAINNNSNSSKTFSRSLLTRTEFDREDGKGKCLPGPLGPISKKTLFYLNH